jgi:hypothetical protein
MAIRSQHTTGQVPQSFVQPEAPGWRPTLRRAGRVCRLDRTVYADVVHEGSALRQAGRIVGIVAGAAAIGAMLIDGWEFGAIAGAALAAVAHWVLWTGLIAVIASWIFHSAVAPRSLLATMGYAQAPQAFAIFGFIPGIGPVVVLLSRLWSAIAGAQATRNTSDLDTRQRIAANVLAFVISFALTTLLKAWLGDIGSWQALVRP